MLKSVLVRLAIVLSALAQSALWNPPGGIAAQVIPVPRAVVPAPAKAGVVASGPAQAVDPLPPIAAPTREKDISPTPAAPAERNGAPLEVGKVLEVKDGGWPDQSSRVDVIDLIGGVESRLPLSQALTALESKLARQVSPFGVAFPLAADGTLPRSSGVMMGNITLDYSGIAFPAGGDMEGRLQFVLGEDCGMRAGETAYGAQTWYDCARWTPLATQIDRAAKRASVNVADLPGRKGDDVIDLSGDPKGEPPPSEVKPSGARIIALATGGSSAEGDYRANALDAVGDYQVGAFAGTAELGYPIPVPPAAAGAAPEVRLGYSSGSIDGFGGNKNGQPGWAGLGWNLSMGSVTRGTRQCSSTNLNRCVIADKFTLTLNGHSSELVRDTAAGAGRYRLQDDPTWRVELKTSSASTHPDQQKEYFLVTTPDGTQYRFGGEIEPETTVDQDSAFYAPMYDLTLCAAAPGKLCDKIWQWNLDRVQDTDGNVVSYFYEQELNYYAAKSPWNLVTYRKPYVRAGNVARIEYTKRNGVDTSPHARVLFGTELRCSNPTQASNCVWPANFIDTPSDLACLATGTCAKGYPTYWTQRRLNHARTQTWDQATSAWTTAGYYEFEYNFPTNGAGSIAKLLMTSITQRPGGAYERSAFSQIEAEDYTTQSGTQLQATDDVGGGKNVAYIDAGDYLVFKNVDFGGSAEGLLIRASNGTATTGTLEFRIDGQSGQVLAGFSVPGILNTWQNFSYYATGVTGVSGIHDLYVRFTGGNLNLNWFRFTPPDGLPGLPSTTFDFKWLDNRKDVAGGVISQTLARVMTVTNGLGGQTVFSYGQSHPCPSPYPSWVRSQYDCFPGYYANDAGTQAGSIVFNKWKVLKFTRQDGFSGNPAEVYTYTYSPPIYTYNDAKDALVSNYWNDFRGHELVTVADANGDKTETRFYRGVNGDRTGSGPANAGPVTWYVTGSDGIQRLDYKWLRGKPYESRRISATGAALTRGETQFVYSITASIGLTAAYFVAPNLITNTLYGSAQAPTKTTQTGYTYDLYGNVLFEKQFGDTSTSADDRMSENVFIDGSNVAYSTTAWILDKPLNKKLWQGTAPGGVAQLKAFSEFAYDGLAYGATPTKGNMTASRSYATFVSWSDYTRYEATTSYDAYGRPISVTDANTQTTNTSYHLFYGYAQTVTLPAAQSGQPRMSALTVMDPGWGNVLQVTDANGQVVSLSYDTYGRRTGVTLPLDTGNTQEFYYYNLERPARVLSRQLTSSGVYLESHQLVDGFGRNLQAQVNDTTAGYRLLTSGLMDGLGQTRYASGSYQASGLAGTGYVTPTWASIPTYSAPAYDALGRQVVDEARSFTTTLYSSTLSYQGWKTIATDANGKPSAREADAFGQLITVTEYLSNATISQATTYAYDYQGNLVKLVDALGNTTTITYDLLGRKLGMRDPDMGVWAYQYDGNGNLTLQTDARGQQVQFLFDALNRPIETRDPNASWTLEKRYYDEAGYGLSKGRRTRAEAYVGGALNNTIATTYDARGRVTLDRRSIGGENYDTQASYDSANRALTSTLLTGEVLTPSYNSLGQAYSLSGSQAYVNGAFYNYLGKPSEIQLANGLSQLTNYFGVDTPAAFGTSQFGRLRQICVVTTAAGNCYDDQRTGGTTATKLNLVYWFDALGNLTAMGDRSAGYTVGGSGNTAHTYAYDDLNRLISGSASGGEFPNFSSAWTFDGLGNMTSKAGMVQGYSASGPSSVRPHAVITSSSALDGNYNYDANGNMTTRMDASVTYTQSWDAQNRLGSVTASTKNTAWVYDADGARVSKNDGAITTVYIGGSVEVQISGTLRLTTTYYFFGGARIAMRVGANVTFLHGDRLGSASLATDAAGNVLSQERYYVWGSASMMSGTMPTDFQWQNQRRLDEAQAGRLYDFNARFFMPVTGRFISPDSIVPNPADPQSLNRYTAMANNPLRFTDPSGHAQISEAYESCGGACLGGYTYTGGGGSSGGGSSGGGSSGGSNGSSGGILPGPPKLKSASSGYDVTKWLVKFMNQMQNLPIAQSILSFNKNPCDILGCLRKVLAFYLFITLVQNGAPWDIKIEMESQLGPELVIGGKWFEYSTPGNIAYGFLGAALGFTRAEIAIGAGGAQAYDYCVVACSGKTPCEVGPIAANPRPIGKAGPGPMLPGIWPLGDTVDDAYAVRLGYELYGATRGNATVSALTVAISGRAHLMAHRGGSGPAEDAIDISSSPVDRFEHKAAP